MSKNNARGILNRIAIMIYVAVFAFCTLVGLIGVVTLISSPPFETVGMTRSDSWIIVFLFFLAPTLAKTVYQYVLYDQFILNPFKRAK